MNHTKAIRVDQLRFEKVLGRGSFGKVMLTSIAGCEHKVAVKAMKKHVVQSNGDVVATAVEKRMLELGMLSIQRIICFRAEFGLTIITDTIPVYLQ